MKIYVINGPNMNMLGVREPELYGEGRLTDLEKLVENRCDALGIDCECFQSNHEGELVDIIQSAYENADGIIINAAAYTHTSVAILDALKAVGLPAVLIVFADQTTVLQKGGGGRLGGGLKGQQPHRTFLL